MADPKYFTVVKAANRVKRTRRTIERWISAGDLTVITLDGIRYISEENLLEAFRTRLAANPNRPRHAGQEQDGVTPSR